jgi:hypothetical protein
MPEVHHCFLFRRIHCILTKSECDPNKVLLYLYRLGLYSERMKGGVKEWVCYLFLRK